MAHPYLTPKELEEELVNLCGCNQVLIPQKDEGPGHVKATVFYNLVLIPQKKEGPGNEKATVFYNFNYCQKYRVN